MGPLSDIYSLGCTLYYAVTGKVPYPGGDTKSKCRRHCEQMPMHPRRFAPQLSEDFVDIIGDAMEKDPSSRTQSAAEFAERLEPWVGTDADMVDRQVDRQSWMPPPPPQEPSQLRDSVELLEFQTSGGLSASGGSPSDLAPPPVPTDWPPEAQQSRRGVAVPIAIALAVTIPLSLLVGAIIGFVVRGNL